MFDMIDLVLPLFSVVELNSLLNPFQSGMLLATHCIAGQDKILFLLTSRLGQDCLKNVSNSVRLRNPTATPLEFSKNLKCVLFAQYLQVPSRSNYDADDHHFFGDLLQLPPNPRQSRERGGICMLFVSRRGS